jgi:hypothetical protein
MSDELAILDALWTTLRIRLHGPFIGVGYFIVKDLGACAERIWTGEDWGRAPKYYPTLQAAFDDLPNICRFLT